MLLVHVNGLGEREVCFLQPAAGREVLTGARFAAPKGRMRWQFRRHAVAFFAFESAGPSGTEH